MHSLRQRYGSNLVHTHAGPNMVVINPISSPSMYSEKVSCSLCTWWKFFDKNPDILNTDKSMIWILSSCFSRWCRCSRAAGRRTLLLTSTAWPRLPTGTSSPLDRISPSFYWERVGVERPPIASISSSTSLPSLAAPTRPSLVGRNWPKFQVRNKIVIQVIFVVCSREMAGSLHRVRGIWECVHLSEWKCQSLLPCCVFGLWPGRSGDFSLHSGIYLVLSFLSDYSCTWPASNAGITRSQPIQIKTQHNTKTI